MLVHHPKVPTGSLLERFCTPASPPESPFDVKAAADADVLSFEFDAQHLAGYAWGTGTPVLLLHGWGSRASHWSPLARALAGAGLRAIAFDAPAHGKSRKPQEPQQSSMFEYCRAVHAVSRQIPPLYAVVGHSLGAAAAIFLNAGYADLADYAISVERLAAISAPEDLRRMIALFCQQNGLDTAAEGLLTQQLEVAFNFSVAGYSVAPALERAAAEVLLVHDEEDDVVPVSSARHLHQARPDARFALTRGSGHQRILGNRAMIRAVKNFLR